MKKIIDYLKKNYIMCMVFIAIILVIIGSIIIIKILVPKNESVNPQTKEFAFYNFFETQRYDFTAKVNYENDKITGIDCNECNLNDNIGIIYYKDKNKIILQDLFAIVFYYQESISYKLPTYTDIENNEGTNIVITEGEKHLMENFFLFDGEGVYFFINDVTLTINGQKYELNKFSYISVSNDEILYYDYGSDKPVIINNVASASVRVKNVDIDLLKAVVVDKNKKIILSNEVEALPKYKEN